jgi:2'-5' RNA ligase
MPYSENLYFIAIIPKRELREKITASKQDFANRFNSSKALKVYPHITLKAPFKYPSNAHQRVLDWFENLQIDQQPFTIGLKDFGAFHNKNNPVIFIHPEPNTQLQSMQQEIIKDFKTFLPEMVHPTDLKFSPHVTIAYRDLDIDNFQKAWKEYQHKKFDALFEVDAFYLLQHDSKKWNIIATHDLNQEVAL